MATEPLTSNPKLWPGPLPEYTAEKLAENWPNRVDPLLLSGPYTPVYSARAEIQVREAEIERLRAALERIQGATRAAGLAALEAVDHSRAAVETISAPSAADARPTEASGLKAPEASGSATVGADPTHGLPHLDTCKLKYGGTKCTCGLL